MCKTFFLSVVFVLLLIVVPDVSAAMLSHYTFDTDASDSGTLPRNGTIVGGAGIASGGPQGSGYLSLTGGHVDLPAYGGPGWIAGGVTVTAWVKADNPSVGGDIFSQAWYSPSNGTIQMRQTASGTQVVSMVTTATAGVPAAAGEWYHIAWVGRAVSGMHEIWINGVKTGETWMPWAAWPANVFKAMDGAATIGSWGTSNVLMGGIDDLRIYDEALDASGIVATIPEPATLILLGLGGLLLRKRK